MACFGEGIDPSFVIFEQPAKPFTTLDQAISVALWSGWRKEQDIALALMISLMMKMLYILCQCIAERRFSEQDQLRQTLLLDRSHPALCIGIQIGTPGRQRYPLHP